jgi:hypothetical protein
MHTTLCAPFHAHHSQHFWSPYHIPSPQKKTACGMWHLSLKLPLTMPALLQAQHALHQSTLPAPPTHYGCKEGEATGGPVRCAARAWAIIHATRCPPKAAPFYVP